MNGIEGNSNVKFSGSRKLNTGDTKPSSEHTFYGAEQSSIREQVEVALEYYLVNALHRDRDDFSNMHVLPWLVDTFPQVQCAETALDLGSSHGISAVALAGKFPSLDSINFC